MSSNRPGAHSHEHNVLSVLTREDCLKLLSRALVGRVGLTVDALPVILPVNFALLGEDVVIRTGRGTKLGATTDRQVVCFEVDGFDPATRTGWSVLATGMAEVLEDPEILAQAQALRLEPWAPPPQDNYVRIQTTLLSGRRIDLKAVAKTN